MLGHLAQPSGGQQLRDVGERTVAARAAPGGASLTACIWLG